MSSPVVQKIAPALPNVAGTSASLNQAAQAVTPTNSSPSQGAAACRNTELQDLAGPVLTPPGTTNCEPFPLFEDELPSPPLMTQPDTAKDPFVTTPVSKFSHPVNPAADPTIQITASIIDNKRYTGIRHIEPPRADRLHQTDPYNAQGLFLKDAKLFVANLSNRLTDDRLERSVGRVFRSFGPCTVIVKRDRNDHPMAFVQYQLIQDAEAAMAKLNGRWLNGRVIRVERANARQDLIISMTSAEPLTEQAVRRALAQCGPISSVTPFRSSAVSGQAITAWLVGFVYYADCKETINLMRGNETYRVVPAPKEQRQYPNSVAPARTSQVDSSLEVDERSIFLGSLPYGVTEDEIRDLFAPFGTIVSCSIISKHMLVGMNTFAFVEFRYAVDAANAAVTTQYLRGQPIRVERKQYDQRRASRLASAAAHFHGPFAPRPQYLQQYAAGPMVAPYQPMAPYHPGHQGLAVPVYNAIPPAPMYMQPYPQYIQPAPRMRQHHSYHGPPQMSPNLHYGGTGSSNQGAYNQQRDNFVQWSAGTEEQDGSVFNN